MRHLFGRWFSKEQHKTDLEKLLLRQCLITTVLWLGSLTVVTASTWALFSEKISLGSYGAEASTWGVGIMRNGTALTEDTVYLLPGPRNRFDITATGNGGKGFCYVVLDGEEYITKTLEPGDTLTFYVKVRGKIDYEIATASEADCAAATASEADREEDQEIPWSEMEMLFLPQLGRSPVESELQLYGLEGGTPMLADADELAYVIADGETLYCGEAPESQPSTTGTNGGDPGQAGADTKAGGTDQSDNAGSAGTPQGDTGRGSGTGDTTGSADTPVKVPEGGDGTGTGEELGGTAEPGETTMPDDTGMPGETSVPDIGDTSGEPAVPDDTGRSGEPAGPGDMTAPGSAPEPDKDKEVSDETSTSEVPAGEPAMDITAESIAE